jgi:hypothetical protein
VIAEKFCAGCETTKALDQYTVRKTGPRLGQPVSRCKACQTTAFKERTANDPSLYRRVQWPSKLKTLYGITVDDYYGMLSEQGNGCATCGSKTPGNRHYKRNGRIEMFHVDHCHSTGRVRGLLCGSCNRAIGFLRDDPDIAQRISHYLR